MKVIGGSRYWKRISFWRRCSIKWVITEKPSPKNLKVLKKAILRQLTKRGRVTKSEISLLMRGVILGLRIWKREEWPVGTRSFLRSFISFEQVPINESIRMLTNKLNEKENARKLLKHLLVQTG